MEKEQNHQSYSIQSLFEFYPASVFLMEQDGNILDANETFALRMGKNLQECLEANVYDLLPADSAALRREKAEETLRTGTPLSFEDERNGRVLRHTIYPSRSPEGEINRLLIVAEDISDFRRTELELRESERMFRSITEQISEVVFVNNSIGEVSYVSPIVEKITGYKPEELIGHVFFEYLAEEEIPRAIAIFTDAMSRQLTNQIVELTYRKKKRFTLSGRNSFTIF